MSNLDNSDPRGYYQIFLKHVKKNTEPDGSIFRSNILQTSMWVLKGTVNT